MRKKSIGKLAAAVAIAMSLNIGNAQALDVLTDLNSYTSGIAPTTAGNTTTITTTNNIDLYNWSSFNLGSSETANFVFSTNGQTAVNYVNPGLNPSSLMGNIQGSGASGNVMLFNPNGITISGSAGVANLNNFFVSTSQFDGISGNKVMFSEPDVTNALTVNNITFNNVNNAHFVAPGVVFNNGSTAGALSIRAIESGEYDVAGNIFSAEQGYGNIQINGNLQATTALTDENGSIYLMAGRVVLNGDIDVSGSNGGAVNINTKDFDHYGSIKALGNDGEGGVVDIQATKYTATSNAEIDVSGKTGGGDINLVADYQILTSGSCKATSSEGKGGNINISAPLLKQLSVNIDASGHTGGGEIYLGVENSQLNTLSDGSIVKANATGEHGDGGII